MIAHSYLPPSGAAAWSRCPLWPTMNARYPQDDSAASIEGTAAHWVLSEMLAGRSTVEGQLAPNGVTVTGEMLDGAELAYETIARRTAGAAELHIEETVNIPVHPDCFGTPDVWTFALGMAHLEIIDYKYGHGFVDEFWNAQGLLYMAGILERIKPQLIGNAEYVTVSFTIVQPRCYYRGAPVRTHSYTVQDAKDYLEDLVIAAREATGPNPAGVTNPECGYCPGRHACPTLQNAAYKDAEYAEARQPHDLTPQAAALELRMLERALERLSARVDGLKELTLANMKRGSKIPYYTLEAGRGKRQWTAPPEQIISIGQVLGKDLSKPGLVTPTQAKKMGMEESVIAAYSADIPGNIKLVPQNNTDALRVFGKTGE